MNKEQMVGLAVRLFAIFIVIYTLRYAASVVSFVTLGSSNHTISTLVILFGIVPIFAAFLLWRFPVTVASKLIPKAEETKHPSAWNEIEIQVVAFSLLGLWILSSAIPDAFYWTVLVNGIKNMNFGNLNLPPQYVASIVAVVVRIVLGFWLLIGSRSIVGMVRKLRHVGIR